MATFGILSFAFGAIVFAPLLMKITMLPTIPMIERRPDRRLPIIYIGVGFLTYFVLNPFLGGLPTVTAMLASSWNLVSVGFALLCWKAWCSKRLVLKWILAALILPFITVVFQGFLGYGAVAFLIVFAFVASFYRPRWKVVVGGFVLFYLGLSLYVTYMEKRTEIREVVWGGASITTRMAVWIETVYHLKWFDPENIDHLKRIDNRLNQNFLVGASIRYLEQGRASFAQGKTIREAILAIIPRAIWPDKPMVAGSGDIVTNYTGIPFAEGTSVGVGQVMEFYINFGTAGVIGGFIIFGIIIAFLDRAAAYRLYRGDWQGFTLWFLPGIAFMQVGGSLVEVTSSAGAAVATAYLVNRFLLPYMKGRVIHAPIKNGIKIRRHVVQRP
jgi:hypothetical protein